MVYHAIRGNLEKAWLGKHKARYPLQARFLMLPVRTWLTTFTVPRLTPGGLLSVRLSPASPGAFPQIRIRFVALLRRPPDSGASPCTRLSRAPRWGLTPTSTPTDPPPRIRQLFVPTWRFSPQGRFPFRGLFWLGPWRVRLGSSLAYSPLSFASRARFPVSPTMDSATWGRWWFAAHPNRSLRLPAWREVAPGALLSTFQHAHVIHAVGSLLFITEVETGCCPLRCGRTGGAFPEG